MISFYYLFRVGEYTKPKFITIEGKKQRVTRTVQFSEENVGFLKKGLMLPRSRNLKTLLTANACTLKITNQKNRLLGEIIHQNKINSKHCPLKALTRRVHHILHHGGTSTSLL